jgi:hypothetical protein
MIPISAVDGINFFPKVRRRRKFTRPINLGLSDFGANEKFQPEIGFVITTSKS